jgi:hypothetical protein
MRRVLTASIFGFFWIKKSFLRQGAIVGLLQAKKSKSKLPKAL